MTFLWMTPLDVTRKTGPELRMRHRDPHDDPPQRRDREPSTTRALHSVRPQRREPALSELGQSNRRCAAVPGRANELTAECAVATPAAVRLALAFLGDHRLQGCEDLRTSEGLSKKAR